MIEETFIDKIKFSAAKGMKRIGDQSIRFRAIVYGKGPEPFRRMYSKTKKIKAKMYHMRDSISEKALMKKSGERQKFIHNKK